MIYFLAPLSIFMAYIQILATKGFPRYLANLLLLLALIAIQVSRHLSDLDLDLNIFFLQYTHLDIDNFFILLGRHLLIPLINQCSYFFQSITLNLVPPKALFAILMAYSPALILTCCHNSPVISRRKNYQFSALFALYVIFIFSTPSLVILGNNFVSQYLSGALIIGGLLVGDSSARAGISAYYLLLSICLIVLGLMNHLTSFLLLAVYIGALLMRRFDNLFFRIALSLLVMTSISAIFSLPFVQQLVSAKEAYNSSLSDTSMFRLLIRIAYPWLIGYIIFRPSTLFRKLLDDKFICASIYGSIVCVLIYSLNLHGAAWRFEYYFSLLTAVSLVRLYSCGQLKTRAPSIFVPLLLIGAALPLYFYQNIYRLFIY